ncbi:protease inhibitor I42 family protein [Chloroflexota bacterium]
MILKYSSAQKIFILIFILIMVLSMVASSACSGPSSIAPNEVFVREFDTGKEVQVAIGGTLTVQLESNPSAGSKWELIDISDTDVLENIDYKFEAAMIKRAADSPPIVGAPGRELWTFKTLKKGKSEITMQNSQPLVGGTSGAKSFNLIVIAE